MYLKNFFERKKNAYEKKTLTGFTRYIEYKTKEIIHERNINYLRSPIFDRLINAYIHAHRIVHVPTSWLLPVRANRNDSHLQK